MRTYSKKPSIGVPNEPLSLSTLMSEELNCFAPQSNRDGVNENESKLQSLST
jgi:hypothetical protein